MAKPKKNTVSTLSSDQKKITQYFLRKGQPAEKPQNGQPRDKSRTKNHKPSIPVAIIDLVDSDDEPTSLSSSHSNTNDSLPSGSHSVNGNGNRRGIPVWLPVVKKENEEIEPPVVANEPAEEIEVPVDLSSYDIRVIDFKKIMETDDEASSSSTSMLQLLTTPTKAKPFASPARPRTSPKRSPKSKLNHLSPIRHLNRRSTSKTPTKGVSTVNLKSPFKSTVLNSPHKSLWAPKPDPYYLKNLLTVINYVVGDSHNSNLMNEEDCEILQNFHCLTKSAQCLFARLLNRKKWQRVDMIKYPLIADDLSPFFEELGRKKLLTPISEDKLELRGLLELLTQDMIVEICKQFHLLGKVKSKDKCLTALLDASERQQTLLNRGSMADIIYKAAVKAVGPTFKISDSTRSLFSRIFILFSPPQYWDQNAERGSNQLLTILLNEIGQMTYPTYTVKKSRKIYKTRDDLIRFVDSWTLHSSIEAYMESKQWNEVVSVGQEALDKLKRLLSEPDIVTYDKSLPLFLRAYTAGSILTRTSWLAVEGYQKNKDYKTANEFLTFLLSQDMYLHHYHGRWHERIVINSKHLKLSQQKTRDLLIVALADKHTTNCHRLDLTLRLEKLNVDENKRKEKEKQKKINQKKRNKKKKPKARTTRNSNKFDVDSSTEEDLSSSESEDEVESASTPNLDGSQDFHIKHKLFERTIEGEKMPMFDREYGKSVFLGGTSSTGSNLSSVEQFAIQYYKNNEGYIFGAHSEGSLPATIYGLLFWNIIYSDDIDDVFICPYQAFPLDLFFDDFRVQRQLLIEEMLTNLRFRWCLNDALELIDRTWHENHNKLSIVNWNVCSLDELKVLVKAMDLQLVAGICDRLSQNYRYYRSGFPDLMLWNQQTCLFSEVKGPGDTLSTKQRHWLDYLKSLNANVELCTVKSVSNKRFRTS